MAYISPWDDRPIYSKKTQAVARGRKPCNPVLAQPKLNQALGHVGKTSRPEDRDQHLRSVISDMRQETGADRVHEGPDCPANHAHDENDQQRSPRVSVL